MKDAFLPTMSRPVPQKSAPERPADRRRSDQRQRALVTQAELARVRGVARSTVSRAVHQGGPLHAALHGDRVDAAHPAVVAWVGFTSDPMPYGMPLAMAQERGLIRRPQRALVTRETGATASEFAASAGMALDEAEAVLRGELAPAVIPRGHISVEEFAARADVESDEIMAALALELAPALLPSGRIDLGHAASLAFMSARPFAKSEDGDVDAPENVLGEPWLAPACVGADDIDPTHPVARAFIARCRGREATGAELERAAQS